VPSNLNLVRISPFAGVGLVTLEPQLLFAVVDSYFGGSGRHTKVEGRDFTATEMQIVQMLLHQVFSGLKDAWSPVMGIDMEYISSEMNPTFVNISSPTEIVVVSRFHVEFEGNGGNVDVTMPYSMIDPIKELLMAGIQGGGTERDKHWGQSLRNKLEDTEVDLLTVLCRAQVSLRDLIELRPGAVIPCDFDGSATVTGDGITLFKGDLGHQRGRQVVKVTEMMGRKHNNALDALVRTS
jgi:flagellar motor switch protein FliM